MQEAAGFGAATAGWIAGWNYLGYLLGALAASLVAARGMRVEVLLASLAASVVTTAAVRLLGLDPISVTALHARHVATPGDWSNVAPRDLPAAGGTLSEILAQHHGTWSHRLFVA